jgi:hypothetical protein
MINFLESNFFSFSFFLFLRSKKVVDNSNSINFWLDSLIYAKTKFSLVSICDVSNMGNFKFNLTHGVSLAMRQEKTQFLDILNSLTLTFNNDSTI